MSTSSKKFCSPENIEKRNVETIDEKDEMQEYEKRILQCILPEKITPMDLKHWPMFHVLKPEFIQEIHMIMLYSLYSAVIVTKDKNVYNLIYKADRFSWNSNFQIASDLKKIEELCGKNIKTIAAGGDFKLVLTEEREIYFLKFDIRKCSTERESVEYTLIRVSGFSTKRIVNIACDKNCFLVLTSDGEVYACKDTILLNYIYIQNRNTVIFNNIMKQVKHGLEKKNVVHIACDTNFNIVVTDENKLYALSKNGEYLREITTFSDKIVKVVCEFLHVFALTNKGEVYAWDRSYDKQIHLDIWKSSDPILVNVPQMVLNIEIFHQLCIAVGYDRTIYVWGRCFDQIITQPFPTKFSSIFDVFAHLNGFPRISTYIMHNSLHIERIMNNYKSIQILKSLGAAFDDLSTSDFTIQVERQSIYVHKAILNSRCQYFRDMFHDLTENVQSISDSVYIVPDKFSYIVYKAFLKYLYTGKIDLPSENALELMELADMYCETNLKKDCSQIIKPTIEAMKYNTIELEEFGSQFTLRHVTANTLSEDYFELDMSIKAKFTHRAATKSRVTITSSKKFSFPGDVEKKNSETTINEKDEMQKCEKRIMQCILTEKITSMDLKYWLFFHQLKSEFIPHIRMVMIYGHNRIIIVTKDKNVYSLGQHRISSLNTDVVDTVLCPKRIEELCGKNIKTFTHSACVILALTEEGEVYFAKNNNLYDQDYVPTFTRITGLSDKYIVDIRCGNHHRLGLTNDGKVYVWGYISTPYNQNANFSNGRRVKHGLEKRNIVHIACGNQFNIVVTNDNTIYGWGCNMNSTISVQRQRYYKYPHKIIRISDKIVKVVCGDEHTLVLTNKGKVYAWGNNDKGQVGVNNNYKPSGPIVVNVPEMGKVLDIAAYRDLSVAVGNDRTIYAWGYFLKCNTPIPFPTMFSNIHDVFAYSMKTMYESLIVFTNNFNNFEEELNILESLRAIFDDPLTSDLIIRVEEQPIYVHKAILKIRCQYFNNMFQHDWIENIQSTSNSVYTVSEKFSYIVYKAFLKYLYIGIINLPSENALELMELADMYCETNLKEDCIQIIKQTITVSNVAFFYEMAIKCLAKELEEFCFQFALRHMEAVVVSKEFIELDTSTKDNFMRKVAKEHIFEI